MRASCFLLHTQCLWFLCILFQHNFIAHYRHSLCFKELDKYIDDLYRVFNVKIILAYNFSYGMKSKSIQFAGLEHINMKKRTYYFRIIILSVEYNQLENWFERESIDSPHIHIIESNSVME